MGEMLPDQLGHISPQMPEQSGITEAPLSYRERLRRGVGQAAEGGLSLLNIGAGIMLAREDLRAANRTMNSIDASYAGLIGRQAGAEQISMQLESDIILDFRRDAQRAGFTDVDAMPAALRAEAASSAVERYRNDLAQELAVYHPDWTNEQLEMAVQARLDDMVTLLSMTEPQHESYLADELQYYELRSAAAEIQGELDHLQTERRERLSRIGGAALRGLVRFAGRVRNLPNVVSAHVVVTGMGLVDKVRAMSPESRRKTFWGTAAGVAIAGIAGYIALRSGRAPGASGSNLMLASADSPLLPDSIGSPSDVPFEYVGTPRPIPAEHVGGAGAFAVPTDHVGSTVNLPDYVGGSLDVPSSHIGTTDALPSHVGTEVQPPVDHVGGNSPLPDYVGGRQSVPGSHVGAEPMLPDQVGGGEGLPMNSQSSDLFGGTSEIRAWPDKIRVSAWDARTLDGSLTGISRQMLIRSGVSHPTTAQVDALVDALRPQAQPNGHLLKDQELDLRPATRVLSGLLRS